MNAGEQDLTRVPPHSIDAEMAVLGAMLLDREAVPKVLAHLDEKSFYKESHKYVFATMVELFNEGEPIDVVTVSNLLEQKKVLEKAGGNFYIAGLVEQLPSTSNVEYYAKIVLEKAILRRLIQISSNLASDAYDSPEGVDDLLERAEREIFALSERKLRQGFQHIDPLLHETFERIEAFHNRQGITTGIPTGYKRIDELTAGFQDSDLIIVAGRPSMGKTAFALSVARNVAVNQKVPVGIFSLEMANYQLALRFLSSESEVDAHLVRTGRLPKELWSRLSEKVGKLAEAPIFIDDNAGVTLLEIRAKARRLVTEKRAKMIIVDYLQLIRGTRSSESRQQEISEISRSLKAMAKELNIPVVAISQLSRAVETRGGDKRPQLSDLRESGAIEQDADVVLFIFRPFFYTHDPEDEGKAEIIIAKQRNGPTGTVELVFRSKIARFDEKSIYDETEVPAPF
jgi:replicative DNA helicase